MDHEIVMTFGQFLEMLFSAFVLGFSLRTLVVWSQLMWRIKRARNHPVPKHLVQ